MKLYSWNVNGLRAVLKKGALQKFIAEHRPDVLCLQEIKARPDQVLLDLPGYEEFWHPATRPGYSGTAIFVNQDSLKNAYISDKKSTNGVFSQTMPNPPDDFFLPQTPSSVIINHTPIKPQRSQENIISSPDKYGDVHNEGRILTLEFKDFFLVNVYTPNSKPDLSRLELRETYWDPGFLNYLKNLEQQKPVITCGDFNAAHTELDLARPKTNHHSAGFTDEERRGITNLLDAGFIDTFRLKNPDVARYTWWSHWGNARANNVGWRIDYFFISALLKKSLLAADIHEPVLGSDHCPVSIELETK